MTTVPTIGRIVHYKLAQWDVDAINKRRQDARDHYQGHVEGATGVQVHVGNEVREGDVFPALIVRTWGATPESAVQLQVFLDGNDTYWASSRAHGETAGQFTWPNRG